MKKLMMSFAFLLAIGGAFLTKAAAGPLADRFYEADPANKASTCRLINCNDLGGPACDLITTGFSTYKSIGSQAPCFTVKTLNKIVP